MNPNPTTPVSASCCRRKTAWPSWPTKSSKKLANGPAEPCSCRTIAPSGKKCIGSTSNCTKRCSLTESWTNSNNCLSSNNKKWPGCSSMSSGRPDFGSNVRKSRDERRSWPKSRGSSIDWRRISRISQPFCLTCINTRVKSGDIILHDWRSIRKKVLRSGVYIWRATLLHPGAAEPSGAKGQRREEVGASVTRHGCKLFRLQLDRVSKWTNAILEKRTTGHRLRPV